MTETIKQNYSLFKDGFVSRTLFFHSKVDNGSLGRDLWCVVRIAQFSCDVKAELRAVLHFLITKPN